MLATTLDASMKAADRILFLLSVECSTGKSCRMIQHPIFGYESLRLTGAMRCLRPIQLGVMVTAEIGVPFCASAQARSTSASGQKRSRPTDTNPHQWRRQAANRNRWPCTTRRLPRFAAPPEPIRLELGIEPRTKSAGSVQMRKCLLPAILPARTHSRPSGAHNH